MRPRAAVIAAATLLLTLGAWVPGAPAGSGGMPSDRPVPVEQGGLDFPIGGSTAGGQAEPGRRGLHIVQLRGPTKDAWLAQLRRRGVRLVQYIAPFSYAVILDPARRDEVATVPFVRRVGPFDPLHRFGPLDLDGVRTADILLLDDGRLGEALAVLSAGEARVELIGRVPFMDVEAVATRLWIDPSRPPPIDRLPGVWSVVPVRRLELLDEVSDQISAGNYSFLGIPEPGYKQWLAARGLSGHGVVVAHVDSGVDAAHPDLQGRIEGCKDYAFEGQLCAGPNTDIGGHGTHTAGIVVGGGALAATDAGGFTYGLGMAPGAKLYVQNYLSFIGVDVDGDTAPGPGQWQRLNRDSVLGGASISQNSWAIATAGGGPTGYDADTREFDFAPRDADLETSPHEPLALVFSINNGGGGTSTQLPPEEAKNMIVVGSTKSFREGSIDDLSFTTAHGPALDGRQLPHIVAPGERVVSTRASSAFLCAVPILDTWSVFYSECTGTSMASPHVSGAAAIFTEFYRRRTGRDPSPALIKAALINGAVDLAGGKDADGEVLGHIPDNKQGWGRLNLENVLGRTEKAYLDQTVLLQQSGEAYSAVVEPVDPALPVKLTLVWTDAPGPGLGGETPGWVNDLDLRVTAANGTVYLGNSFGVPSTGWSVPGGTADFRNNVENVYLRAVWPATLTVEVLGANIPGDGIPGNGDDTDQDFALVVSNGRFVEGR